MTVTPVYTPPPIGLRELTPELAEQLLANSPGNRRISNATVDAYARDMTNGDWLPNGAPINVTRNGGRLLNGHHRCHAVIKSGVSIMVPIIATDPEAMPTIDTGRARTFSDLLAMKDVKDHASIAGGCRIIAMTHDHNPRHHRRTHHELTRIFDAHEGTFRAESWILQTRRTGNRLRLSRSALWAFTAVTVADPEIDKSDVHLFMHRLANQSDMIEGTGAWLLTRWADRLNGTRGLERPEGYVQYAVIIKAWNADATGHAPAHLRWSTTEPIPAPLPILSA